MTRDSDFAALVRQRMAETGERCTQARAALRPLARDGSARTARGDEAALDASCPAAPQSPRTAPRHDASRSFFDGARLRSISAKRSTRMAVVLALAERFEPGRAYPEPEVTSILGAVHEDHAYLRRELVSAGYLVREAGVYELAAAPPLCDQRWAHEFPSRRARCSRPAGPVRIVTDWGPRDMSRTVSA